MSKLLIVSAIILGLNTSTVLADEYKLANKQHKLVETVQGSLIIFTCPTCSKKSDDDAIVARGSQILEVRKVGNEEKLYRTENIIGGSPVSFVHISPKPYQKTIASDTTTLDNDMLDNPTDISRITPAEILDEEAVSSITDENPTENIVRDIRKKGPEIEIPAVETGGSDRVKTSNPNRFELRLD